MNFLLFVFPGRAERGGGYTYSQTGEAREEGAGGAEGAEGEQADQGD